MKTQHGQGENKGRPVASVPAGLEQGARQVGRRLRQGVCFELAAVATQRRGARPVRDAVRGELPVGANEFWDGADRFCRRRRVLKRHSRLRRDRRGNRRSGRRCRGCGSRRRPGRGREAGSDLKSS